MRPLLFWLLFAPAVAGCALTSKSDVVVSRYFTPERARHAAAPSAARDAGGGPLELRLGRVAAGSHLDQRIVYRRSANELGFYDDLRWTEAPEEYVRRSLSRTFFEERRVRRVVSGAGPTLEVDLSAFEEIRAHPRIARVRLTVRLLEGRIARMEETITVEQPIGATPDHATALANALGVALERSVGRIADRVLGELGRAPAEERMSAAPERSPAR
jgi:cholesterol transport system auxiliary component